jgi:hypothetical protein
MIRIAAGLLLMIGSAHSILGEKYILIPLFRLNNLPQLLGSDFFTKRTLRFAWHLTTVAWWGIAAMLFVISAPPPNLLSICLWIISITFFASGLMSAGFTKGIHVSWIVFFAISFLCAYKAVAG